ACRTPVVASSVGGIKEVVVHEQTGILVDPGLTPGSFEPADAAAFAIALADAINRLAENAGLRAQMADAGLARVRELFTWEAIAAKTASLYRSVISAHANVTQLTTSDVVKGLEA
ncbi:MAG: glycosyltransferase, partial [Pseudomonadota bacterium]|nr:glycosyltransferase [Pseudomonadota bacterium]